MPADLGDGQRPKFSGGVEPRPPRPAERGSFDVEKMAGGHHPALTLIRPAAPATFSRKREKGSAPSPACGRGLG